MGTKLANMKKVMSDEGHKSRIKDAIETNKSHQFFFQGFPVTHELKTYAEGVEAVMPNVKFYPSHFETVRTMDGRYTLVDEFFVYMDEFMFDLGRISYGDNAVGRDKAKTFSVYSRKIANAKYAVHRDQHHMIMTSDVSKAVKNATKYLMPYTHRELAQALYEPMHTDIARVQEKATQKLRIITSDIRTNEMTILSEVHSLLKQGVEFKTPEFKELASKVEEAIENYNYENGRKVTAEFVRFRQVGEDTYVDVQEVHNIRENRWDVRMNTPNITPTTYRLDELPEDIAGQVSVLSILEDDGYVPRVGKKIDDRTYWIERG